MKFSKTGLLISIGLILAAGQVSAQNYLTGELSGTYPAGEYIVSGNIHVLPKSKLIFEAGSFLRFENYAGIVVRGELIARGTVEKPIVFTSVRDVPKTRDMPEAFDWIGIKVTAEAAGVTLENCVISYSNWGLNIESNATPVSIKDIIFINNGSASLTREKKMMPVTDNRGISFNWPEMTSTSPTLADNPPADSSAEKDSTATGMKKKNDRKKEKAKPRFEWMPTLRISLGSAAGAGGIMWLSGYLSSKHYRTITQDPIANYQEKLSADKSYKTWLTVQNIGIGLFCAGAVGFSVTYFF